MKTLAHMVTDGRVARTAILLISTMLLTACVANAQHGSEGDTLQTRPLKLIMVALGQDMNRISDGLWHADFEMIRAGAQAIADHPRVPPEEMAAIKEALKEKFQPFVGFDMQVHHTAVELAAAARHESMEEVLSAYRRIERGCISCHAAFRDDVRAALYARPGSRGNDE